MITCLTRTEYDAEIRRVLGDFALAADPVTLAIEDPAAWAHRAACHQYAKNAQMAALEMRYRGVLPPDDLPPRRWTAGEIDGAIITLEALGRLTPECQLAAAAGVSLVEYRKASNV